LGKDTFGFFVELTQLSLMGVSQWLKMVFNLGVVSNRYMKSNGVRLVVFTPFNCVIPIKKDNKLTDDKWTVNNMMEYIHPNPCFLGGLYTTGRDNNQWYVFNNRWEH
jgi:hypothetical protein